MSAAVAPLLPGGVPLLHHLPAMRRDPLKLMERARAFGDYVRLRLGPRRAILISDPKAIEHVLVEKPALFNKQTRGYAMLRLMLGNGLVTSEGAFWLRQRRIMQPAFHRERIAGFVSIMQRDVDEMLDRWTHTHVAAPFDVAQDLTQLTMRIIAEALFSVDVSGGDGRAAGDALNELIGQAFMRLTAPIQWPLAVPTPMNIRFHRGKRVLDKLMYSIIEHRRRGEDKPDLLSMLMHSVDEETGAKMNDEQLRDEVLTLFSAGHETTSNLLAWTIHCLLDHPDVERKLRAELDVHSPYLDAVLKESMRMYPPIPMVTRCAVEDCAIGGYQVDKGDFVFFSQWLVHRHPKLWPDALAFKPERFLVEDPARPKYAYFPFLGGPRKCIGDQLALMEARVLLVAMLKRFRFARAANAPAVIPEPSVSLRPRHGLWITATLAG